MSIGKLYIGRKIRELRESVGTSQSQFAQRIGISPSYLNQIENNQRPVSALLLLTLAEKFQIDISEFSSSEGNRLLSALSEALSDPLYENYNTSAQDLKLVTQNVPAIAHALIASHQAYRRNSEQLASLDATLGRAAALDQTPFDEVRDFFHFLDNYCHELDIEAERIAQQLGIGSGNIQSILIQHLETTFQIRTEKVIIAGDFIRRFDPKAKQLTLNSYLPASTITFHLGLQVGQIHSNEIITRVIAQAGFRTDEAKELCRVGLHNYFAGALILPYQLFLEKAQELRHDLELLAIHFDASLEQICHRLSTLQRPGQKGVPIFFARVDRAGNITKRHSAAKLQFARFGAACPLWNAHEAFEHPGQIIRQLAETPDGVRYLCLATQITKGRGGFSTKKQPRFALALGCEVSYADQFVYADGLDLSKRDAFEPIGISCRICERENCLSRAVPPYQRRLSIKHDERGQIPYRIF